MKYIILLRPLLLSFSFLIISFHSESQVRDFNFGFNGVVVEIFEGYDRGFELLLQDDNKILHFGSAQEHPTFGDHGIAIARYQYNGELDTTFDEDGTKVVRYDDTYNTQYSSAQLQSDQKILLAGLYGTNRFIQRYHTDGRLDETFADNGTLNFFEDSKTLYTNQHFIRMIDDIQFLVIRRFRTTFQATYSYEFSKHYLDGSLDTTYGDQGVLSLELPSENNYFLGHFEFINDGDLVMAGKLIFTDESEEDKLIMMKLEPNGSINSSFGEAGIATYDTVINSDMKIQEDGKIVFVGTLGLNELGTQGYMAIARFDENGDIDASFGENGSTGIGISSYADYAKSVVIQSDGKIVIGGSFFNFSDGSVTDCAVVRLMPDGSRDADFGENGVFKTGVSSGTDQVTDMVLQDDNKLVFGGFGNFQSFNMVTVRLVIDGLATRGDQTMCVGGSAILTAYTDDPYIGWALESEPEIVLSDQLTFSVNPAEPTTYIFYSATDTVSVDVIILTTPTVSLPNDTTLCTGESLVLDMTIPHAFYYYWSNGTFNPTTTVYEEGEYSIEVSNQCTSLKDTIYVSFQEVPQIYLGNDTTICNNALFSLGTNSEEGLDFLWQDGSEESTLIVENSGTYWVEITNDCASYRDSIDVHFDTVPELTLGEDLALCQGDSYEIELTDLSIDYYWQDGSEGSSFTISNDGEYWVEGSNGCGAFRDSITVSFIPLPEFSLGEDLELCQGELYDLDVSTPGANYTWQDGSEESNFTVSSEGEYWVEIRLDGCSSRDSVYIQYNDPSSTTLEITSCDTYTSPSGIYTWEESGTYLDTIINSFGCDSILTIDLSIPVIDATVIQDQNALTATNSEVSYQWYECTDGLSIIDGEISQTFEASQDGSYAVGLSDGTCEVISECLNVIIDSINEINTSEVSLFPNPANDKTTLTNLTKQMRIEIFDFRGQQVRKYEPIISDKLTIETKNLTPGVYLVKVLSRNDVVYKTFRFVALR